MKAASSIQGDAKITVTKYEIEKMQDSGGRERRRLLIARDGETRGAIVIDSDEEGEEIIKMLTGGSVEDDWKRIRQTRRRLHEFLHIARLSHTYVSERTVWMVLLIVSWSTTLAVLILSHVL